MATTPNSKDLAPPTGLCFYAFMRTTIDLPEPLYKQVKALAAMRGLKLKQLITNALAELVRNDQNKADAGSVPSAIAADLAKYSDPEALRAAYPRGYRIVGPLIVCPNGEVLPNITDEALETMMTEEDLARHGCAG
jgi:hypothetical protein